MTLKFPVTDEMRGHLELSRVPHGEHVSVLEDSYRKFEALVRAQYAQLPEAARHALIVLFCLTHPDHKQKHFEVNHPVVSRKQKLVAILEREDVSVIGRWLFALLVLILLSVHAHAQHGTSRIDVITLVNGDGSIAGTFSAPFKIKVGVNCTWSVSKPTATFNCAGSAGSVAWDSILSPGAGGLTLQQFANGDDFWIVKRKTDTVPTGSFFRFQTAAGADLCALSIAGVFSGCSFPYANLSGTPTLPANTTATAHNFFTAYNSSTGAFTKAQPVCGDLSDAGTLCTSSAALAQTIASVSHKWLNSYTASTGAFTQTQPACGDLSDSSGGCSMSTTAGGDLSGTLPSPTVAKVNGVAYGASPSTDTIPVITAANTETYKAVPDCTDATGNHLNYTASTHAFSCGTTDSHVGTVTSVSGTANEIASTGGATPVLSVASTFDIHGKTSTAPIKAGTTLAAPGSCQANVELYIKTDATAGQQVFICNGAGNGWNLVGDGGGGGGMTNPMTTLGDIIFEDASPTPARLAGNTTTTQEYLAQTGTGSVSAAPAWTSFFSTTGALFGSQYYCPASPATQATINTCLTAVASGGTVILPCNTTYTVSTGGVSIANSNVRLTGCGSSTKLSTSGSTTFHAISTPNQCCLGQNTLSADALTGVTSVTAATNTGLVAGKYVRIVENSSRNYEEVARIKSISGAGPYTVNLDEPMYTDVLVANGGIIQAFNPLTNVEIDHIALDGTGNSGVDSNGIYLIYCASCPIHDIDASNFTGSGLQGDVGYANTYLNIYGENNASAVSDAATWWLRQTHSQMTNIQSLRATATAGFGLLWQYSHDLQVQGALATGGGSTGRGLKLTDTTHSQFVNVIETNFGNSQNFVLDSNSSYNRFSNCQAMSNTGGGFSTFGGSNVGNTFSNCMAKYNTAEAFLQSAGTDDDNSVIGGVYGYQRGSSNVFSIQSNGFRLIGATIADDNGSALKGVVFGSGTTSLGTNTSYSQNGSNVLTVTIANTLKKGDRVTIASATAGTCISAPNGDYQIVSATTSTYTVSWTQATCTPTSGAGTTARWQNQHATIVGNSIRGLPANEDIDMSGTNVGNSQISFNQTPDGITRGGTGVNNTIFEDIGDTGQDTIQESLKLAASTTALASLNVPSGSAPTSPVAGDQWFAASEFDFFGAASTAGSVCPYNSAGTFEDCITAAPTAARTHTLQDFTGTLPTIVASGTIAGTTAAIAAGACGTTATATATGTLTTDIINLTPSAAITASNIGKLTLWFWVTANTVNMNYCNTSAASITPTAITFNWNVIHR